jgi:hypothetical protein
MDPGSGFLNKNPVRILKNIRTKRTISLPRKYWRMKDSIFLSYYNKSNTKNYTVMLLLFYSVDVVVTINLYYIYIYIYIYI